MRIVIALKVIYRRFRTLCQGLYAKFTKKKFVRYIIEKQFEGHSFQFLIGDECSKEWYDDHRVTTPETAFIKERLLQKNNIVADCGSHHGLVSLIAAKEVGALGQVFAFEPLPNNADVIKENAILNSVDNITVEKLALGHSNSMVEFVNDSNGFIASGVSQKPTIQVETITLDAYFKGRKYPDFIKIDVEGNEINVLKGAINIFKDIPCFAIEFHTSCYSEPASALVQFLNLLDLRSYSIYIQLEIDGPICPFNHLQYDPQSISCHDNIHFFGHPLFPHT